MPNPKVGTVTFDVAKAVRELKAGKVEYRVEKAGIVHVPIGKVSFGAEKLIENAHALLGEPRRAPSRRRRRATTPERRRRDRPWGPASGSTRSAHAHAGRREESARESGQKRPTASPSCTSDFGRASVALVAEYRGLTARADGRACARAGARRRRRAARSPRTRSASARCGRRRYAELRQPAARAARRWSSATPIRSRSPRSLVEFAEQNDKLQIDGGAVVEGRSSSRDERQGAAPSCRGARCCCAQLLGAAARRRRRSCCRTSQRTGRAQLARLVDALGSSAAASARRRRVAAITSESGTRKEEHVRMASDPRAGEGLSSRT